jgi:methionyl aminopeptidase
MIKIKTEEEIKIMAEAGKLLAKVIKEVAGMVEPGISTKELDRAAEGLILSFKAKPSFKNYNGFPASLCTSINEELVHCIPSEKQLKKGDIISLDGGLYYKGYHADMAVTIPVGEVNDEAQRLIRTTKKALKRGIAKVRPGITFGDLGNAIQRYIEGQGYGVVRDLCGHGIGESLHEDPEVANYGKRNRGEKIREGMVFCIEPMVTVGDYNIKKAKDGYGIQTKDGSLCAHFEHTIAVTKSGCKILTEL